MSVLPDIVSAIKKLDEVKHVRFNPREHYAIVYLKHYSRETAEFIRKLSTSYAKTSGARILISELRNNKMIVLRELP